MATALEMYRYLKDVFGDDGKIDFNVSEPFLDVRYYPGRYDGKDWQVEVVIETGNPTNLEAGFWSAAPEDVYNHIKDTGDAVSAAVVECAKGIVRAIRGSEYLLAGLGDLEREALRALHEVVIASSGDIDGLRTAIENAKALTSGFFHYTPADESDANPEVPAARM